MVVRDLVQPFAELNPGQPVDDLVSQWRERVVAPHAALYHAIQPWLDPGDAGDALPGLMSRRGEFLRRTRRAHDAVHRAHALLAEAVPDAGPVNAVVLVGLGKANGWATLIDGEPILFMTVDQLPEPGFDVVLALHEMIHAEHLRRAARDWPENRMDADLFREGLAVYATARLLPGIALGGHLWFAPGHGEWMTRCRQRDVSLRRRALADLRRDDLSHLWFGGGPDRDGELPGRCGYWLGWKLVERLMARESLETAMQWPLTDVSGRLQRLLQRPTPQRSE